jgi:Zn-dependent protease
LPPLSAILGFFAILVLSLSFHEAAHAWAADRLGDPTARRLGRLTMNPLSHIDLFGTVIFPLVALTTVGFFFGWAKPVPVDVRNLRAPRRDFALVAAAGPASNLVLAFVAAALLSLVFGSRGVPGLDSVEGVLTWVVLLNVLLAVFNMVPVPPLDGGNVLAGFVPEPVAKLIDAMRPWGFLILFGLLYTGVLWWLIEPVRFALVEFFL